VSPRLPGSRPAPAPRTPEAERIAYGKTLRSWREAAELTQAQLAAKVGVGHVTISRVERGEVMPGDDVMAKIEGVLGALRSRPGSLAGLEPWVRVGLALMAGGGE
jgi:transcriptional regulator with XRE-family HTH domain